MTLLEEIQNAAVDGKSDLGTTLRKCKVLASQLGSQPLADWLIWEANGYPNDAPVPNYRVWPLHVKGHFAGMLQSQLRNAPIELALLPEGAREHYEQYKCRQSIAAIEAGVATGEQSLCVSTGDLSLHLGNIYEDYTCLESWATFGVGHFIELLNSVRNRLLDFVLALAKEHLPITDSTKSGTLSVTSERVTQIFNMAVYGGVASFVGTANSSPVSVNVGPGDFSSLEKLLREYGVDTREIGELETIVTSESPTDQKRLGPKAAAWIGKMVSKAAEGTWSVAIETASSLLMKAIEKYYGL